MQIINMRLKFLGSFDENALLESNPPLLRNASNTRFTSSRIRLLIAFGQRPPRLLRIKKSPLTIPLLFVEVASKVTKRLWR
jgi:hypothetical protein